MAKDQNLQVRCDPDELELYARAAQLDGESLSAWVRRSLRAAAMNRLGALVLSELKAGKRKKEATRDW